MDLAQARLVLAACPSPLLIADVASSGLDVLAISPLFRRFVVGARHPAGPQPGEILALEGFAGLEQVLEEAINDPTAQHHMELPVGDDPTWYDLTVTPVSTDGTCRQIVVTATERVTVADSQQDRLRGVRRRDAIAAHSTHLGFLVDSVGRMHSWNPQVHEALELRASATAGESIFTLLHPDSTAAAIAWFDQVRSTPNASLVVDDLGFSRSDGTYVWCDASGTNLLHDEDVAAIVVSAWDITDRRQREQRLQLAHDTDPVTGLASRAAFLRRLDEMIEAAHQRGGEVRLFAIDVGDLATLTGQVGLATVDGVLVTIANRLSRLGGESAHCASLGNSRFALAAPTNAVTSNTTGAEVAEEIRRTTSASVHVNAHHVQLIVGVGEAVSTSDHVSPANGSARELLWAAEAALGH
jgi:PAS domain S-box-containing protein